MPTSVATAVVLALAIIPGAFGGYIWAALNGEDWREKDWQAAIRYLAFSALGLALYVLLSIPLDWLPPAHVVPATYAEATLRSTRLAPIALPYLGHIVLSGVVAVIAAGLHRLVQRWSGRTIRPSAWDEFITSEAIRRCASVTLKSGDVYAGYIETAERSVASNERDIVLAYPAKYDPETEQYLVTSFRAVFLPAELIQNIGVVREPEDRAPTPAIGQPLFPSEVLYPSENLYPRGEDDREEDSTSSTSPADPEQGRRSQGRLQSDTPADGAKGPGTTTAVDATNQEVEDGRDRA